MKQVGKNFDNRIIIILIDQANSESLLTNLYPHCIDHNFKTLIALSNEHAAQLILELREKRPASIVQKFKPKTASITDPKNTNLESTLAACFASSRTGINSTDAKNLIVNYKTPFALANSDSKQKEISLIKGFGDLKSKRLAELFSQEFCSTK